MKSNGKIRSRAFVAVVAFLLPCTMRTMGQLGDGEGRPFLCTAQDPDLYFGVCDDPTERDSWDINRLGPEVFMKIRTKMIVFADDNGDFPAVSATLRAAQIDRLISDFEPYKLLVDIEDVVENDSRFRYFCTEIETGGCSQSISYCCDDSQPPEPDPEQCCDSWDPRPGCDLEDYEEVKMKNCYADEGKLNIFITQSSNDWAVYPWSSRAATATGGVMKMSTGVGGFDCGQGNSEQCVWLTHEVGHVLGLRHTHDWSEFAYACGYCNEPASCTGDCSDPDCNLFGDLCCDTPATGGHVCSSYGGDEGCPPGDPLPEPDIENFMGYSGDGCADHFTPQQARRMHCWVCNALPEWIDSPDCNNNDTPDVCDITRGTSDDCDENGVPDECQMNMIPAACCYDVGECLVLTECACDELSGTYVSTEESCGPFCAMFGP